VAEIGVHLDHHLGAEFERAREPVAPRAPAAPVLRAVQEPQARLGLRGVRDEAPGAVGRVVVDHQHLVARPERQELARQRQDVLRLVVGRDRADHARLPAPVRGVLC
jgi:hypothetical protein